MGWVLLGVFLDRKAARQAYSGRGKAADGRCLWVLFRCAHKFSGGATGFGDTPGARTGNACFEAGTLRPAEAGPLEGRNPGSRGLHFVQSCFGGLQSESWSFGMMKSVSLHGLNSI